MKIHKRPLVGIFLFAVFTTSLLPESFSITRYEIMEIAKSYLSEKPGGIEWSCSEGNVTGNRPVQAADGKYIMTPKWVLPNEKLIGIPYKWGGFSSLDQFVAGLRASAPLYAGDIQCRIPGTTTYYPKGSSWAEGVQRPFYCGHQIKIFNLQF